MISHEHIAVHEEPAFLADFFESRQEESPVLVVSTDLLATVAATQDVVESTGKLNANFSAAFSLHVQFTLLVRLSARLQGRTRFGKATAIPSREPDRRR
jgi:hypothetical protein